MSTVPPPPPKRQRVEAATRAQQQFVPEQKKEPQGSVRIQFTNHATGDPFGSSILVPIAQLTHKNLEVLINSLKGIEDPTEHVPYQFRHRLAKNIDEFRDIVAPHGEGSVGEQETAQQLEFSPQTVFRVRAVTRCGATIPGHGQPILAVAFSPISSNRLVSGSGDKTARIFDCDTGTPKHTLSGHGSWVLAVAYSPDGSIIATGSHDKTVRLWDADSGQPLGGPLKGHTKYVRSLCWEPYHLQKSGRPRVASSSEDSTVRIWDAVGRRIDMVLSGHKSAVPCVKWGGCGFIYTASHDRTVKIWNASTGTLAATLSAHAHWVNHLALSTEFVLRTGYHDHTEVIPESEEGKLKKAKERFQSAATIEGHTIERLVTASDDMTMYLWEPVRTNSTDPPSPNAKHIARMTGHQKPINHVAFSPNGLYIASASFDNHLKLWNAATGAFLVSCRGHVAAVYQCCFSPDSRLIASGSKDTTLKVWDVSSGKLRQDLPGHKDEVYALDWAPTGAIVGSGGKDKAVRLWRH